MRGWRRVLGGAAALACAGLALAVFALTVRGYWRADVAGVEWVQGGRVHYAEVWSWDRRLGIMVGSYPPGATADGLYVRTERPDAVKSFWGEMGEGVASAGWGSPVYVQGWGALWAAALAVWPQLWLRLRRHRRALERGFPAEVPNGKTP